MVRLVLVKLNVQVKDHWGTGMLRHPPVRLGAYCLPNGLSFIKSAASKETICNSENVITLSPIDNVIALLTDLTSASDIPFYHHGASADEKIYLRPCDTPNC